MFKIVLSFILGSIVGAISWHVISNYTRANTYAMQQVNDIWHLAGNLDLMLQSRPDDVIQDLQFRIALGLEQEEQLLNSIISESDRYSSQDKLEYSLEILQESAK